MSIDELAAAADALVASGVTPACQLAVARDGELVCFETFGAATNDTRFCVFSATKPIVAAAVWLLVGDRALDVAAPVAHYVPEFATHGKDAVTVEQVLLHTSGFPNAPIDAVEGADPASRLRRFAQWRLEWEPGSRFEYHPLSAHWVLAELIERASGIDFRDFVEQRVCAPLGLPRLLGIGAGDQHDVADGVRIDGPATPPIEVDTTRFNDPLVRAAGVPGGGAIATAATMARFYQALLRNPGGLWDAAVLDDAKTHVRCRYPEPLMQVPVNRTLGLVLAGDDGLHQFRYAIFGKGNSPGAFGHAGAHAQVAWADPETGVSFAFLKNGWATDMFADAVHVLPLSDLAASIA
jgi:CubicO group peptidase (beta-lactamase class C family)